MKKHIDLIAYPFLSEQKALVDHEILTDSLCSTLGYIYSLDTPLKKETWWLMEQVLHLNGSVRGKNAIEETTIEEGLKMYQGLKEKIAGRVGGFVLPVGHPIACQYHMARCQAKQVARNLYILQHQEVDVPETCIDFANLVANILFAMSVEVNRIFNIEEKNFVSKSY